MFVVNNDRRCETHAFQVNVGNLVEYMLSKAEAWERIQTYMRNIMRIKEDDESECGSPGDK